MGTRKSTNPRKSATPEARTTPATRATAKAGPRLEPSPSPEHVARVKARGRRVRAEAMAPEQDQADAPEQGEQG